jgi:hypothetical protein
LVGVGEEQLAQIERVVMSEQDVARAGDLRELVEIKLEGFGVLVADVVAAFHQCFQQSLGAEAAGFQGVAVVFLAFEVRGKGEVL